MPGFHEQSKEKQYPEKGAVHRFGTKNDGSQSKGLVWFGLCCLMTPGLSKDISVMYDHTFSKLANHHMRHQATYIAGCQPGYCIWSLQSYPGVVWV